MMKRLLITIALLIIIGFLLPVQEVKAFCFPINILNITSIPLGNTCNKNSPLDNFNELTSPLINEARQKRQHLASSDPDYYNRVDENLNKNRVNFVFFGINEEHGETYADKAGSATVLSYDLSSAKVGIISLSRDIVAPTLFKYHFYTIYPMLRHAYRDGGFTSLRETIEQATGLAVDYQIVYKDTVLRDFIQEISGPLTINSPQEYITVSYRIGGEDKDVNGGYIPKGIQTMNADQAMRFIFGEYYDPQAPQDERSFRQKIFLQTLKETTFNKLFKKKDLSTLLAINNLLNFMQKRLNNGEILLDFDPKILSNVLSITSNYANKLKEGKVGLKFQPPELDPDQSVLINDGIFLGEGVVRIHNIRDNSENYQNAHPIVRQLIDEGSQMFGDWMMVAKGGNPDSQNLPQDYYFSIRNVIKKHLPEGGQVVTIPQTGIVPAPTEDEAISDIPPLANVQFEAFSLTASNVCSKEGKNLVVLTWSKPKDTKGQELKVKKIQLRYKDFLYPENFGIEKPYINFYQTPGDKTDVILGREIHPFGRYQFNVIAELEDGAKYYSNHIDHKTGNMCTDSPTVLINSILAGGTSDFNSLQKIAQQVCPTAGLDPGTDGFTKCRDYIASLGPDPGCARIVTNKLKSGSVWWGGVMSTVIACAKSQYPPKTVTATSAGTPAAGETIDSEQETETIDKMCSDNRPGYTQALKEQCIKDSLGKCAEIKKTDDFNSCVDEFKKYAVSQIKPNFINKVPNFWEIVGQQCHYILGDIVITNPKAGALCEAASRPCGTKEVADKNDEELVQETIDCIQEKAKTVNYSVAEAPATPGAPSVPAGYNTDFDKHIYAWCGDGNRVTADKKDACALKALNECQAETDEQKFIECVQKIARDGFGGLALLPPKQPFIPQKPAKKTPTALAFINGFSNEEVIAPSGTKSVQVGGEVKDGEICLDTAISLTFFKIEENGKKLAPPILIPLKPNNAPFLSDLPRNCIPYTVNLDEKSGKYQLSIQLTDSLASKTADYNSSQVATNTVTVTQAPAVATKTEIFHCETKIKSVEPYKIEAVVQGDHPAYDRVNWYITEYTPKFKGTNKKGDVAVFDANDGVKPNNYYQIIAQYYSQDVPQNIKDKALYCYPIVVQTPATKQSRVKTTPKQLAAVLGTYTSPISFDILPTVTPESIVAINVRAVALDDSGNETETLFEGSWENGRPLPLTVNNPSEVSAVKVTVSFVDETGQFLPSTDTSIIPISKPAEEVTQIIEAAPQNIDLRMKPDINQVTFTAYTVHPVDNPKFVVNDAEQNPLGSSCDQSGNYCVHSLTLYNPTGSYNVSFAGKTVLYTTPEEQAPEPEATPSEVSQKQITKITLSRDDGSEEQVIYTLDQATNADFDLDVGDNGLKYTVYYSDDTSQPFFFLVERIPQSPASQPEPPAPETNPCPDDEFCEEGTITEKYGGVLDADKNECVYNFRRTERICQ